MPFLDVTDVLTDPDFYDRLICERNQSTTGDDGLAVITTLKHPFIGVVTSDKGEALVRQAVGEHATNSIMVITKFVLIDAGSGYTADIVCWNCLRYTVVKVNPYTRYGAGFVEAVCEMLPLAG